MLSWLTDALSALAMFPGAAAASWAARRGIRTMTRRAVRRAQRSKGNWRVRLDRMADDGHSDTRRRQRADAAAHMLGHFVTGIAFVVAAFMALHFIGVEPVVALSSAGFVGVALALSGQDLIKDLIAGTMALLEDRYAAGDDVVFLVSGTQVAGTVDLIGAASVRLRSADGATWHVGHHKIESVTNLSQLPAVRDIDVPAASWQHTDDAAVADLLSCASNDVGLTGVVFLRDVETFVPSEPTETPGETAAMTPVPAPPMIEPATTAGMVTVRVRTNRPLTSSEEDVVRAKLTS